MVMAGTGAAHISWSWCRAVLTTRQKGCQDCGPLATTVWLLKPASQDLAHRNHQTLSKEHAHKRLCPKMAKDTKFARVLKTTLPPTKARKLVILTPLRSVPHQLLLTGSSLHWKTPHQVPWKHSPPLRSRRKLLCWHTPRHEDQTPSCSSSLDLRLTVVTAHVHNGALHTMPRRCDW